MIHDLPRSGEIMWYEIKNRFKGIIHPIVKYLSFCCDNCMPDMFEAHFLYLLLEQHLHINSKNYDLTKYKQKTCPKLTITLRVYFAHLRHAHCKTNYLGEETRSILL